MCPLNSTVNFELMCFNMCVSSTANYFFLMFNYFQTFKSPWQANTNNQLHLQDVRRNQIVVLICKVNL